MLIQSKKYPTIVVSLYKGEFSLLDCEHGLKDDEIEKGMRTNNPAFALEIYKVLKTAVEIGAFGKLSEEGKEAEETIYV